MTTSCNLGLGFLAHVILTFFNTESELKPDVSNLQLVDRISYKRSINYLNNLGKITLGG